MTTQFDNISNHQLADAIGELDRDIKSREARLEALKREFKARGLTTVSGCNYTVSTSACTTKRLDVKRLRADLGDALDGYEVEGITTRILIKFALEEVA